MGNTTKYTPRKSVKPSDDRKRVSWNSDLTLLLTRPSSGTAGATGDPADPEGYCPRNNITISRFYWERRPYMAYHSTWSSLCCFKNEAGTGKTEKICVLIFKTHVFSALLQKFAEVLVRFVRDFAVSTKSIIPQQETLGNYNYRAGVVIVAPIIPQQKTLGNYNWANDEIKGTYIIPQQETSINCNLKLLISAV